VPQRRGHRGGLTSTESEIATIERHERGGPRPAGGPSCGGGRPRPSTWRVGWAVVVDDGLATGVDRPGRPVWWRWSSVPLAWSWPSPFGPADIARRLPEADAVVTVHNAGPVRSGQPALRSTFTPTSDDEVGPPPAQWPAQTAASRRQGAALAATPWGYIRRVVLSWTGSAAGRAYGGRRGRRRSHAARGPCYPSRQFLWPTPTAG